MSFGPERAARPGTEEQSVDGSGEAGYNRKQNPDFFEKRRRGFP